MHRALSILNAAVAVLQANTNLQASVYPHRVYSISSDEFEVPTVSVRMGVDTPSSSSGQNSLSFIDSELELSVDLWAQATSEQDVLETLLELRAQAHISLQAAFNLGLAYVTDTAYGGASAPDLDASGARVAGHISTRWIVRYRTNYTDPN